MNLIHFISQVMSQETSKSIILLAVSIGTILCNDKDATTSDGFETLSYHLKQKQFGKEEMCMNTTNDKPLGFCISYRDFPEYHFYISLKHYAPYASDIPGVFTNIFTVVTIYNTKYVHVTDMYIFALAYADLMAVATRFTLIMLEKHVETLASDICKLMMYIEKTAKAYSNLVMILWSIEKVFPFVFPIKCVCLRFDRNTKRIITFALLFCMTTSIPYLTIGSVTFDIDNSTNIRECFYQVKKVWHLIEYVYYIYIPTMFVCIGTGLTYYILRRLPKPIIINFETTTLMVKERIHNKEKTVIFLYFATAFIIMHIPYGVMTLIGYRYLDNTTLTFSEPHKYATFLMSKRICYALMQCQDSMKFCILYMCCKQFKLNFKQIFCKGHNLARSSQIEMSAI